MNVGNDYDNNISGSNDNSDRGVDCGEATTTMIAKVKIVGKWK